MWRAQGIPERRKSKSKGPTEGRAQGFEKAAGRQCPWNRVNVGTVCWIREDDK